MNTTYQDIITTFVLDTMLHHVGMLWLIKTHEQLKYDMDIKNSDWMTGGPWCKKLHGKLFEGFLINAIIDRNHIMCSNGAFKKEHQSSSCDYERSGGGCPLPTSLTIESL